MADLTYWVAHALSDSRVYSFRALTRREVLGWLQDPTPEGTFRRTNFSGPRKITVENITGAGRGEIFFNLLCRCLGEGGLREEALDSYDAEPYQKGGRQ